MTSALLSLLGLIVEILILVIIALGIALGILHVVTSNLHNESKSQHTAKHHLASDQSGDEVDEDPRGLAELETASATISSLLKHYMTEAAVATSQIANDTRKTTP